MHPCYPLLGLLLLASLAHCCPSVSWPQSPSGRHQQWQAQGTTGVCLFVHAWMCLWLCVWLGGWVAVTVAVYVCVAACMSCCVV